MSGKTRSGKQKTLTCGITTNVTQETFAKLEQIKRDGSYNFMSEVVRDILQKNRVKYLIKDVSMHAPMEALAVIRKDIKLINRHIQEQTVSIRTSLPDKDVVIELQKIEALYRTLEPKIDALFRIVDKLAEKWLQE